MKQRLKLYRPNTDDKDSFLGGLKEMASPSEVSAWVYLGDSADMTTPERDFESYVSTLLLRETVAPCGFVTDTVYWAKIEDEIVGRISIRHELNDFLKRVGGHIGYIVRPSFRGKGIATEMLRQILQTDRARAIGRLLVTCDETNMASQRTILKNGGVLEDLTEVVPGKPKKMRFWISAHS